MIVESPHHPILFDKITGKGLVSFIQQLKGIDKIFILTDTNTSKLCLPKLLHSHELFKNATILEIDAGEENKTIETCKQVWQTLLKMEATRQSLLINLGGGVITDLGGFVAGTYQRGITFINIPTTLLAQADASVGGKTGVDLEGIKNQIGVFYEPKLVFIDVDFLDTLSKREWLNGYAEIIKHVLLSSVTEWNELMAAQITNKSMIREILFNSVSFKNKVVSADVHEKGLRKILNFGHTVGHAIETFYLEQDKPSLKHGEAVVAGMIVELFLSEKKLKINEGVVREVVSFLDGYYDRVQLEKTDLVRLVEIMRSDKKNRGSEYNFTLLSGIGEPHFNQSLIPSEIEAALKRYMLLA